MNYRLILTFCWLANCYNLKDYVYYTDLIPNGSCPHPEEKSDEPRGGPSLVCAKGLSILSGITLHFLYALVIYCLKSCSSSGFNGKSIGANLVSAVLEIPVAIQSTV